MKLNWNFLGGEQVQNKKPPVEAEGGMNICWNYNNTQHPITGLILPLIFSQLDTGGICLKANLYVTTVVFFFGFVLFVCTDCSFLFVCL